MPSKNIELDYLKLNELIKTLEKDNDEITNAIKNINTAMKRIERNDWTSFEKEDIDNNFMVYLNNAEKRVPLNLASPLLTLKIALYNYYQTESDILKDTEVL